VGRKNSPSEGARQQEPQRVTAAGVVSLVSHHRHELSFAQHPERASGQIHAGSGEPSAESLDI